MARRKSRIILFSRDDRRPPKWNMGRARRRPRQGWRLADPRFYLSAVMAVASMTLLVLPGVADGFIAVARPVSVGDGSCRIYRVVDGDTVRMWCAARGRFAARLVGFDAPELFSPSCPSELASAVRAKWALRRTLWGAEKVSVIREGRDRYDRALIKVFVDGAPVAGQMIAGGFARPYQGGHRGGWCE
jgi:endonuclease YncB( thermonuclease family)